MAYDYNNEEENLEDDDSLIEKILFMDKKKIAIILIILLLLLGGILIGTGIISINGLPHIGPGQNENISFTDEDGVEISVRGSITKNGDTQTFNTDGTELTLPMNPADTKRVSIQTKGITKGLTVGSVTILDPNGNVISTTIGNATYDANGQLILTINPNLDLGLTGDPSVYEGLAQEYIFQVTLADPNNEEEVIFEIPMTIMFAEFIGTGCIALNRSNVSETTHYGMLELNVKLRVLCSTEEDLLARADWSSKNMGPVEVLFNSSFSNGTSLVDEYQTIKSRLTQGEYNLKLFFTPSSKYAGDRAKFDVDFKFGNAIQTIKFDVAVENLEQCISVTADDPIITSESDQATILIDAKNCKSNKINIYLCDNDYGCSGGTKEGVINLDNSYFVLSGGKSKTVTVKRGDLAGLYGVTVHASIPGMEKTFIDEKEITVLPTTEYVYPEKFAISLLESGTKDSVTMKNTLLAEDVDVDASICDLYEYSLGITSNESWLYKMYGDYDYYSGEGLYVAGLTDAIAEMNNAMFSIKNLSYTENTLIKDAYLTSKDLDEDATALATAATTSLAATEDLQDALDDKVTTADTSLANSILSLVTTITSLSLDTTLMNTHLTSAATQATALSTSTPCIAARPALATASTSINTAATDAKSVGGGVLEAVEVVNSLYSIYTQIEALSADNSTIEVDNAIENIEDTVDSINSAQEDAASALDYALLGLNAAAIDSLTSASSDDLTAKQYFELAKTDTQSASDSLDSSITTMLAAFDSITTALDDDTEEWELWAQGLSLLTSLFTAWDWIPSSSARVLDGIEIAQAAINEARMDAEINYIATNDCQSTNTNCATHPCNNLVFTPTTTPITSELGVAATPAARIVSVSVSVASTITTLYDLFELYETFANDYTDELTEVNAQFNTLTTGIYALQVDAALAVTDLTSAVAAAQKLYNYERDSSDAATYLEDNFVTGDFSEKNRMQGLVGSIISTGFVDGAKEGGVYSTSDTVGAADCDNRVTMKLPDYQINLLNDAGNITVSNNDIIAQWDFSEASVYDFFKEQEATITFSDNGLAQNSYAIVEIPIKKHSHAATTLETGDFGPFNITDSLVEDITYKYHFKFNMEERKAANPDRTAVCEKGILFGETGEEAGAQTILSWDWNAINSVTAEEKYLDATQFSILISKKLSTLDNFFRRVNISCPDNYALETARSIVPFTVELAGSSDCYLPLSTYYYEGKPSLYHQLDYTIDVSDYPDGYDSFFDEPLISNAEEFLSVVDFEVNLMLDGYGTNFQDDFEEDYRNTLLKSNAAFTDPLVGTYKYFSNDNIFFYSSKAKGYYKTTDFLIPDAGKYRVRLLIDFDGDSPQLFSGGATKAKIIVDLELIEPINKDFSPLYYTPFDGTVGLKINNNRKDYGTALSSGSEFDVVRKEGIFLSNDQKDALAQLKNTKLQSFVWMNSLASRRAKILDYTYSVNGESNIIFSPSTATPVLMEINGTLGTIPYLTYAVSKGTDQIEPSSNSLFLWTGIDGCNDFYGGKLNELVNNTPDYRTNEGYGMFFAQPNNPGTVYLKTIAYTPTEAAYGLTHGGDGQIITTNYLLPVDGATQLDGISKMSYNDLPNNSKIDSLLDLFDAVDNGSVCVSQLGNREIYWWPEEYLFEKDNATEDNLRDQELNAKVKCIR